MHWLNQPNYLWRNRMPLIIFRYLSRQLLQVMLAVSSVVLLIIMSGRFVNYLADAASGSLRADFLLMIMAYRIPEFLVMILPLGFFLGILLSYGQLYVDNEMTVLNACGMSRNQLLGLTMIPAIGVMILVAFLSLYIAPKGIQKVEAIFNEQRSLTEFDTLIPGRFRRMGSRVTYTQSLSDNRQMMDQVFIASNSGPGNFGSMSLVLADSARINRPEDENGYRFLVLNDGVRYDMTPGQPQLRETRFGTYGIRMEETSARREITKEKAMDTSVLLASDSINYIAELQWRISLPLLIPIIVLLGLPLAKVNPRQGRFVKLLPGILLYLLYIALLMNARGALDDGRVSPAVGLWWVHGLYLSIALIMYCYEPVKLAITRRRAVNA